MNIFLQRPLHSYSFALIALILALALRWILNPWLGGEFAIVTVFAAVAAAVWVAGLGPALMSSVLGYLGANYLFIPPTGSLVMENSSNIAGLFAYAVSCGVMIILGKISRHVRLEAAGRGEPLQLTLASIGDAVITTDKDARITFMNTVASDLTGWSGASAMGKSLGEVFRLKEEHNRQSVDLPSDVLLKKNTHLPFSANLLLLNHEGMEYNVEGKIMAFYDRAAGRRGLVVVFRDATHRRRIEANLLRSERDLAEFFENSSLGMHMADSDGTIIQANQAELNLLGYSKGEFVGRPIMEFYVNQDACEQILARLREGQEVRDEAVQLRAKDGSVKDVLLSANALFENGRFIHSRNFMRDVTDKKRSEEVRALLAAIVSASDDAIVSKSLDGIILSWNAAAERMFGYTKAEAIGQPITMIIPPELQDQEPEFLARLGKGERIDHFETVRLSKDGRRLDLSLTISPVFDESGRVVGASKVARDISEQKRSMYALQVSEQRFRMMADAAPVLIWIADKERRGTWFNRRWIEFTGRPIEEELGSGWTDNIHPDDYGRALRSYMDSFNARQPFTIEFRYKHHDGSYRWLLNNGTPLYAVGHQFSGYIGSCIDISERKKAEEALRRADQRKNEFLAMLAHELRNPLAPIGNALELLKAADHDRNLLVQSRDIIERQLSHMVRLVDDLLDISRITRDKIILRQTRVELASVAYQAVETARPLSESRNQTIKVEVPKETLYLKADGVRLAQVFSNLLNNALKFSPRGATVWLSVEQESRQAVIRVKDQGTGINKDQLESIFDMFTQSSDTMALSVEGLGIGLTLAKRLVEMHGGSIRAHSEGLGHGSEFVVRLPLLASSAVRDISGRNDHRKTSSPRRILVVDDSVDSAETMAILLKLQGHEIRTAFDGLEAVQESEEFRPDLVLLDIGLPKLNGYQACEEIRSRPWGRKIAIVAVTGWGQEEDRRKSEKAGFDAHLVKPVTHAALQKLVTEQVSHELS